MKERGLKVLAGVLAAMLAIAISCTESFGLSSKTLMRENHSPDSSFH